MDRFTNLLPRGNNNNSNKKKVPLRTVVSYVFDYAIIIVLAVAYALLDKLVTPFHQRFSLNNISIQYPFVYNERVPLFACLVISGAVPILIIAVYTLFVDGMFSHTRAGSRMKRYTWGERLWELNCGILGLLLSQGSAFVVTGSLKNLVGKPRPDFISRCRPQAGAADQIPFGLSSRAICTNTDFYIMQDGFRSFPSGHASGSFAGLFYLSLYLAAKLHVTDQRGEVWRTFIVLVPNLAAACIVATRIMDSRHHPFDVMFGSALGILCAWAAYRQYFPPVSYTWEKGRAYPMRSWGLALKRPDGVMGSDGQVYGYNYSTGRVDRSENAAAVARDEEEARPVGYGLEPMRKGPSTMDRSLSPGYTSPHEDTDYEHVRPAKTGTALAGNEGLQQRGPVEQDGNTFRAQVQRNQNMRDEDKSEDEDDLGYRRPLNVPQRA